MNIKISLETTQKKHDFSTLNTFIISLKNFASEPFQIHTHTQGCIQLNHPYPGSIEQKISPVYYEHYVYVTIESKSLNQIFLSTNLLRELCAFAHYDIELFVKDIS